jgi:prephenate dehydrogenase
MTIRITIIGLGQVGASIGLALAGQGEMFQRTGNDRSMETTRRAQKMGAIDQAAINLPSAVREADIVLLDLPLDEVRETLQVIAQDLKENAVVMDTSAVKVATIGWAKELLSENRHYIGLTPVINPAYLRISESGIDAARADLFQRGLFAIVTPQGTSAEALKLATDLIHLLGADPLFADALEVDGLIAAADTLPYLLAVGLLNATLGQPGWREARKLTGPAFAAATLPGRLSPSSKSLSSAVLLNRENVLRVLDRAISALQALRDDIDHNDAAGLESSLESARKGHDQWVNERWAANWNSEGLPESVLQSMKSQDAFSRLLGGGWKRKDRNQPGGTNRER